MPIARILIFVALLTCIGCKSPTSGPTLADGSQGYTGTYRYKSTPKNEYFSPRWLRLDQDNVYTEFDLGPHQEERTVKNGHWQVFTGSQLYIVLDGESFPVERGSFGLRLVVSDDRGEYYQRVR